MFNLFNKKDKGDGVFLMFDIGGTKMRVAVSYDGRNISNVTSAPTPKSFAEGMRGLSLIISELSGGRKIKKVAGGMAAILSKDKSGIYRSPNLPEWNGASMKKELMLMCKAPVELENDATLSALAEATIGAGKGKGIVVYYTISTGVGGARIVNGRIDKNVYGFEPGHQIIRDGDLESGVSGGALLKQMGISPKLIMDPVKHSDMANKLAIGLHNSILHWSPDVVVLGGPMMLGENPISLEMTKDYLLKLPPVFPELPQLKLAELGDEAGLLGALMLAVGY